MAVESPPAPWARIVGRFTHVAAPPSGVGVKVTIRPVPSGVSAVVGGSSLRAVSAVTCASDSDGYLVGPTGQRFVDVLAPGPGVSPAGPWAYMVGIVANGRLVEHEVVLSQGTVLDLALLGVDSGVPTPPDPGGGSTPPSPSRPALIDNKNGTLTAVNIPEGPDGVLNVPASLIISEADGILTTRENDG